MASAWFDPSVERGFRRAAALAAMQRDEPAAMHVELFFLREAPFVKAAGAQRLALRALHGRWPPELDDLAHDAVLLPGRPN